MLCIFVSSIYDSASIWQMTTPPLRRPRKAAPKRARARFTPEYGLLLERLIAARKAAGVTQKEVAAHLGKEQSHVSKCEHRETEISIIDLWKWCEAIGLPVSKLMRQFENDVKDLQRED